MATQPDVVVYRQHGYGKMNQQSARACSAKRFIMAQDLKSYLETFAKTSPEQVIEEKRVLDQSQHEVSAYLKLHEDYGQFPIVVFRNVRSLSANRSLFPLVHNTFATRSRCAMAIGGQCIPSDQDSRARSESYLSFSLWLWPIFLLHISGKKDFS